MSTNDIPGAPYDPTAFAAPATPAAAGAGQAAPANAGAPSGFVQTASGTYQQVSSAAQPAEQPVSYDPMTGQPIYASQQQAAFDPAAATRSAYSPADQAYGQQQFSQQAYGQQPYGQQPYYQQPYGAPHKEKIVAGLLAIFLGTLGIHKFYLGYTKEGVIMLLVSLLTFGLGAIVMAVIALIEGILYLTKSDPEFDAIYAYGHKGWF